MKVMIVEDEEGIRKLLVKIVSKNESFQVVAECAGFHDAIKMYSECQPDIIFMDIEIKENEADENASDRVKRFRNRLPKRRWYPGPKPRDAVFTGSLRHPE